MKPYGYSGWQRLGRACGGLAAVALGWLLIQGDVSAQLCPSTPGNAYSFLAVDGEDESKCPVFPVVHWVDPNIVYECDFLLEAGRGVACGGTPATCASLCRDAANAWNAGLAGHFRFLDATASTPVQFCGEDGRTSISGGTTDCSGGAFGSNVLAVALRVNFVPTGELVDSDITINQNPGAFVFTPARFQATLGHEFGHTIGLDHPNQCGQNVNVLMRSASMFSELDPCFVREPTVDDLNGALVIYPDAVTLCGDADGSGGITDADAFQALRSAAGLSSSCSVETCDMNGDFVLDDVDAVNVFRAAAGQSFNNNCATF